MTRWLLALLLLGLASWAMPAHAITPQQAMQDCANYDAGYSGTVQCIDMGNVVPSTLCSAGGPASPNVGYICGLRTSSAGAVSGYVTFQYSFDFSSCVAPMEYDTTTHGCVDKAAACLARNDDRPQNDTGIFTGQKCVNGCVYGARTGKTGTASTGGVTIIYGNVGYTGETCSDPDPDVEPEPAGMTCTAGGGGMTMCVRSDGQHCFSADGQGGLDTGQMLCWQPGETGEKSAGNVIQKREPGNPPTPTPPTAPPGETTTPSTGPTTTNTTTPTNTNINTSVTNHTTNNGTDGPNQEGQPNDGSGGNEGDGEGETGSGGEGCDTPPVCSDMGSLGCATLRQVWHSRCSPNKNKIEGGGECDANGNPVLVCSGDQVLCKQTLYQAQEHCRAKKADGNGDGQPDWTTPGEGDGTEGGGEDPGVGEVVRNLPIGVDRFDESGFLGDRTCPAMGVLDLGEFGSYDLDENGKLCDLLSATRLVLILVASFLAFGILSGRS